MLGQEAIPTTHRWPLENPSALLQLREEFQSGGFEVLAMTRVSSWPFNPARAREALSALTEMGLPIFFALENLFTSIPDDMKKVQSRLRDGPAPPKPEVPSGIDPELWAQEAGWRDFRKNWPGR